MTTAANGSTSAASTLVLAALAARSSGNTPMSTAGTSTIPICRTRQASPTSAEPATSQPSLGGRSRVSRATQTHQIAAITTARNGTSVMNVYERWKNNGWNSKNRAAPSASDGGSARL